MTFFTDLLKSMSVKIFVKNEVSGSGVLYLDSKQKSYVFTAAHVLCGKEYENEIKLEDINLEFENKEIINYHISQICTIEYYKTNDIDIAAIELAFDVYPNNLQNYSVSNIFVPEKKYQFRGYPCQSDNEPRNFSNYEFNDEVNEYKFRIKGPAVDFQHIPSSNDNSFDGISGSGIFAIHGAEVFLYGIIIGFSDKDGAFGTMDCIKIGALESMINLDYQSPCIEYNEIKSQIDDFRKKVELSEIEKFIIDKHEQVCNLNRKMNVITNNNKVDTEEKVRAHIKSYLYGDAYLEYLKGHYPHIRNKHDDMLDIFKLTLQQGSNYVSTLFDAIKKYEDIRKEYAELVEEELKKYITQEKITRLYSYGIAHCLAICELDIKKVKELK